jgi:hypothetical protein
LGAFLTNLQLRSGVFCENDSMRRLTHRGLQRAAWIALFALFVQALLPSLLHASTKKYVELGEICTAFGLKKLTLSASDTTTDAPQRQHCPICSLADAIYLPDSQLPFALPAPLLFALPDHPESHQYRLIRLNLHLRGPPSYA